jgi:hypothetical protein
VLGANAPQIEAEQQADISESFDIEAVPSFLILRVSRLWLGWDML